MHYKDKNLQIDIRCHTVFMNDQKIELSLKEFTVLKYLTEHPGWVFSHEEIYRNVHPLGVFLSYLLHFSALVRTEIEKKHIPKM